jgi:type IV pilus assembly protein PilC
VVFVVPRFEEIFNGLLNGRPMPAFTRFVIGLSTGARDHLPALLIGAAVAGGAFAALRQTRPGRAALDRLRLHFPILGELHRKTAVARFTRTLGTLTTNGVPILQALQIVKDTAGNGVVAGAVQVVHDRVADGEPMAGPLRESGVFPALVAGMIDIGEQTGALPEMLNRVADACDEEVDHATAALTSLLEPILIVFLAIIVGAIVIALFLPLIDVVLNFDSGGAGAGSPGGGGGDAP